MGPQVHEPSICLVAGLFLLKIPGISPARFGQGIHEDPTFQIPRLGEHLRKVIRMLKTLARLLEALDKGLLPQVIPGQAQCTKGQHRSSAHPLPRWGDAKHPGHDKDGSSAQHNEGHRPTPVRQIGSYAEAYAAAGCISGRAAGCISGRAAGCISGRATHETR